jgi:hypothetical protein
LFLGFLEAFGVADPRALNQCCGDWFALDIITYLGHLIELITVRAGTLMIVEILDRKIGRPVMVEVEEVTVVMSDYDVRMRVNDLCCRWLRQCQHSHSRSAGRNRVHVDQLMD